LTLPLGDWLSACHQTWSSFYDPSTQEVYNIKATTGRTKYTRIFQPSIHAIRASQQPWFSLVASVPSEPLNRQLLPATIHQDPLFDAYMFQVSVSPSEIPPDRCANTTDHIASDDTAAISPHPYYREILQWNTNSISLYAECIAAAIAVNDLHICADGVFREPIWQGSHAWVFFTSDQCIFWKDLL
jgi:hypothetical protein